MTKKVMPITQRVKASYSDPESPGKKFGDVFKGDAGSSGAAAVPKGVGGGTTSAPSAGPTTSAGPATVSEGPSTTPSVSDSDTATTSGDKKGLTMNQKIGIGLAAATVLPAIGALAARKKAKKKKEDLPTPNIS